MALVDQKLNTDLEQDDALLPKPALPPRIAAQQVQRSNQPPYVPNQNVLTVLVKNKRQITSLTAGTSVFCVRIVSFHLFDFFSFNKIRL